MVIFHCYVSSPEGKHYAIWRSETVLVVRIFRELRPDATNFKLDTAIVFLAACRIVSESCLGEDCDGPAEQYPM